MVLEHARGATGVQLPLVLLRFALSLNNEGHSTFWLHLFIDFLASLSLFIYFTRHCVTSSVNRFSVQIHCPDDITNRPSKEHISSST